MHAFVRKFLLVASASLGASAAVAGTNGLYLPSAPAGSGGEDAIETSTGTRCRQSINSNGAYMDVGIIGNAGSPPPERGGGFFTDTREREATAYARVTIPLGARPQRIDCSKVYDLELAKLKREIELLRMNAQ